MKKSLLIVLLTLMTCGCVCINDVSLDTLVDTTLTSKYKLYNHVNSGYKCYLPRSLTARVTDEYNEIISSKYYDYYLFVDLVAYYNKKTSVYFTSDTIYYSKLINNGDKKGIIDVKKVDDTFLVKVIYNYAKVEVKCNEDDLNEVITNALVILSSINYVDDIVANLLNKNEFASAEEKVNIFDNATGDTNYLDEVDDTYTGNESDDYDPDVIKERR